MNDEKFTQEEIIKTLKFSIASKYESIEVYEEIFESLKGEQSSTLVHKFISDEKGNVENLLQLLKALNPSVNVI